MLKLYDYLESIMEEHNNRQWFYETRLEFFSSEIMQMLEIADDVETAASLNRAVQACKTLGIPVHRNFKKVFRYYDGYMIIDWQLSPLACYLVIINCNPDHENVARAQLYFAMNQMAH